METPSLKKHRHEAICQFDRMDDSFGPLLAACDFAHRAPSDNLVDFIAIQNPGLGRHAEPVHDYRLIHVAICALRIGQLESELRGLKPENKINRVPCKRKI
jgi:hypothetical protein